MFKKSIFILAVAVAAGRAGKPATPQAVEQPTTTYTQNGQNLAL